MDFDVIQGIMLLCAYDNSEMTVSVKLSTHRAKKS